MTNTERRLALARARRKALEYAEAVEGTDYNDAYDFSRTKELANMWANVANAMKVGQSLEADGVIDDGPHSAFHTPTITR